MRIIRYRQTWRVVESFSGGEYCLEELALQKAYRVSAICEELGCSQRYFYTVFLRDVGLSPKHWMGLERMVVARRKLEGGLPISQVASDLGFMSMAAFGRRFYRVYRISPGRFVTKRRLFDPPDQDQSI